MPGSMFQGAINMAPASRVVDQDHQCDRSTPENIKGVESLIQKIFFTKIQLVAICSWL